MSENEAISMHVNVQSHLKPKMSAEVASNTLEFLIKDMWLRRRNDPEDPSTRVIMLGLRSQFDLRSLIENRFKEQEDVIPLCAFCEQHILMVFSSFSLDPSEKGFHRVSVAVAMIARQHCTIIVQWVWRQGKERDTAQSVPHSGLTCQNS